MARARILQTLVAHRWTLLGLGIFIAYLLVVTAIHLEGRNSAARGETPLLTDFTSLYAASILVRRQAAADLYRPREMYRASLLAAQEAYNGKLTENQVRTIGFHPWMYPPTFILLALPLAYLPYFVAWLAWLAVTSIPYLLAMRTVLKGQSFWLISLGAPPVFFNIMYGQTGFLTAGLIALGLAWLSPRPILAGVCIGLASVKPHFGILIPLALICGAHWHSFAAAVLTVIGTIALSLLLLGADPWYGLIGTAAFNLGGFERNAYTWGAMVSLLSGFHQIGFSIGIAWKMQLLAAVAGAVFVCLAWWKTPERKSRPALESAVLCSATLLAVPMAYLYDLVLLVPAIAWLWKDMREHGHRTGELVCLVIACVGMLGLRETSSVSGNLAGSFPAAILLGICAWRMKSVTAGPPTARPS